MIGLDSRVETVLGDASSAKVKAVHNLGIDTVGDLLWHFPRRYLKTGELTNVENLSVGDQLTIVGEIAHSAVRTYPDRRSGRTAYRTEVSVRTGGTSLSMTFFAKTKHVADWYAGRLQVGRRGVFVGQAGRFRDQWQLTNPQMVIFGDQADESTVAALDALKALYPIYPLTAKLDSWDLARAVSFALSVLGDLTDPLPEALRREHDLPDLRQALQWIHGPDDWGQVQRAQRRFRFEEALVTQLVLVRRRAAQQALGGRARPGGGGLLAAFDQRLPFELTAGQREVGAVLEAELGEERAMNRLLQGEVGSGKTLVALRAMLRVVDSGGQAALLAPTEVLAAQHARSLENLLGELAGGGMLGGAAEATRVALLTGSMTKAQRQQPLLDIVTGEAGIVVGTHALLEDAVEFHDLGLVVVDEQHRFGVEQRAALAAKSDQPPHVLVMTATPIPRTVAMTVFGDLEVSTLRELPAGRAPIGTTVVPLAEYPSWEGRIWQRVREEVGKGHQVYVVCPRIRGDELEQGESDQPDFDEDGVEQPLAKRSLAAVDEVFEQVGDTLTGLRVAKLHGKLAPEEKDATMRSFAAGEIDVLIATTVIEVGVDVANATMMVLLDADRFGISQLHQLRGRVGRGGLPGLCLLVSHAEAGSPARERLDAVAATTDGFALSQVDLEQRREGDVLGRSQSGWGSSLQNLRVLRDEKTIVEARAAAEALLAEDPDLRSAPELADRVTALETSSAGDFVEKS